MKKIKKKTPQFGFALDWFPYIGKRVTAKTLQNSLNFPCELGHFVDHMYFNYAYRGNQFFGSLTNHVS